ncbi:MAG: DUF1540 domain-containing protein [Oscillospiraceae bacterium]|nr:DUF1540 domain-containing protein [Oscillospiraceae bacterium]MDD7470478.1 DUF1540 domain-containing protein [Oscillospiraceae bacterium]MDY2678779.1 DUF1540 domain-containing protein [Oscillospiraceae bacterium]
MKKNKNESIGCTVDTCKYHCTDSNCCSRNGIEVGACNCHADSSESTCCQSFEMKSTY